MKQTKKGCWHQKNVVLGKKRECRWGWGGLGKHCRSSRRRLGKLPGAGKTRAAAPAFYIATLLPYLAQKCLLRYLEQKSPKLMQTQSSSACLRACQKILSFDEAVSLKWSHSQVICTVDARQKFFLKRQNKFCNFRENQPNPICSKKNEWNQGEWKLNQGFFKSLCVVISFPSEPSKLH